MPKFKLPFSLLALGNTPRPTAPDFVALPGHAFFTRAVDVPPGLDKDGLDSFAELSLEEISPFPLEQLAWGWTVDDEHRRIFLFAACKSRLNGLLPSGWTNAIHVFPAFLPLLFHRAETREALLFRHDGSMTALAYEPGVAFPVKMIHQNVAANSDGPAADDSAANALREPMEQAGFLCRPQLYTSIEVKLSGSGRVRFNTAAMDSAGAPALTETLVLSGPALWRADLRDRDFIHREQKDRLLQNRLFGGLLACFAVAGLLLLLSLVYLFWGWGLQMRHSKISRLEPQVLSVQNSDMLLQRLRQFSGEPFMPFHALGILNEFRPRSIYFRSCSLNNENQITIQGVASNVDEVNQYSERLRRSGSFSSVDLVNVQTRAGDIQFTLNLLYSAVSASTETVDSIALNP